MKIQKLGFWASVTSLSTFLLYIICFIGNYFTNSSFVWTNSSSFISFSNTHPQLFKYIAMSLMIVFSFSFTIQLECLRELVCEKNRFFMRVAVHFAIAFSVLISINYFVQISAVRLQIVSNQAGDISQFVQANPNSFISAVNLLGWTLFLGMACLFASMAMGKTTVERVLKYSFLGNAFMMLTCSITYIFSCIVIQALFMFLGLGLAILVESAAMCVYYKRTAADAIAN